MLWRLLKPQAHMRPYLAAQEIFAQGTLGLGLLDPRLYVHVHAPPMAHDIRKGARATPVLAKISSDLYTPADARMGCANFVELDALQHG